jgi:signal transduction protein with GAF and PtsI domain
VTDHAAVHVHEPLSSLWTLDEISLLVSRNGNPSETLSNIATLIRQRFETDVCSVYLLEPDRANLVLAATEGLRPESVGQIRMRITEGLAGLVAEQVKPVVVLDATAHPALQVLPRRR